jgi:hypothetical protein
LQKLQIDLQNGTCTYTQLRGAIGTDRIADGTRPHRCDLFLGPRLLRAMQVGEARRVADLGNLEKAVVKGRAAVQPGIIAQ